MPFEKGKSGNPGGRPKVVGDVQLLARENTKEAIVTFVVSWRMQRHLTRPGWPQRILFLIVATAGHLKQSIKAL